MAKEKVHEHTALIRDEGTLGGSQSGRSVDYSKFDYRPTILRSWALIALLVLTALLFGLVEFAVVALPHGSIRLPIDSNDLADVHQGLNSMVGRQVLENETSSELQSASVPSTTLDLFTTTSTECLDCTSATMPSAYLQSSETYTPTFPHATPPGAYLQLAETVSVSASADYEGVVADTTSSSLEPKISTTVSTAYLGFNEAFATSTAAAAYVDPSETITSSLTEATPPSAYIASVETYTSSATPPSAYVDPSETASAPTVGATPGAAYDFNMAAQHDQGTTVVYTWTAAQVFVGTYLPVLVAVCYRIWWSILHNHLALIDPFRQMTQTNGARAETVLFSFYQSRSSMLDLFRALFRGRWGLSSSATAAALTCILPALASEAIWVDTTWDCPNPKVGSNNPCPARMTVSVVVVRVLQALLAVSVLLGLFVILDLRRRSTGLRSCPSSVAGVANLVRHPALESDFRAVQANSREGGRLAKRPLAGKRYRLGSWEDRWGVQCYGVQPVSTSEDDLLAEGPMQVVPKTDSNMQAYDYTSPQDPTNDSSKASRWTFQDMALVIMVLGTFGVVLAYYLDYRDDGFNRFFNSNTFGPRFILTGAGTVIAHFWKEIEHSTVVMAPFIRLTQRPSGYTSTIAFSPSIVPVMATLAAIRSRYWLAAAVTLVALSSEALNIVISGIPFSPGQVHSQFTISAYMSLAILGFMIIIILMVLALRRQQAHVPIAPYTLAAKMSYLVGSNILDDFAGSEYQDSGVRDHRLRRMRKRYMLRDKVLPDG